VGEWRTDGEQASEAAVARRSSAHHGVSPRKAPGCSLGVIHPRRLREPLALPSTSGGGAEGRGILAPGGASALAPAKTAHQGVSTGAPPRATRSHFTCLPT